MRSEIKLIDTQTGVTVNLAKIIPRDMPVKLMFLISKEAYIGANAIRNEMITSMRKTKKAPWWYWRQTKSGKKKKHHPSAPHYPPAVDSGELISRIVADNRYDEIEVGVEAGAPYAIYLEDIKGLNRPFLMPAAEKEWPQAEKKIVKVIQDYLDKL